MPQIFVAASPGTRFPYRARFLNSPTTIVRVVSAVSYAAIGAAYTAGMQAQTAYGAHPRTFDTTAFSWLLLAVRGTAYPVLLMEGDFSTVDTILGADWALLARVADGRLYSVPQI